jgi:hypothetical protein
MSGLFSPLATLGGFPSVSPVVFIATLLPAGPSASGSGFVDLSADLLVGTAESIVLADLFGPGRDLSVTSTVFGTDGQGGPVEIEIDAGAGPDTASAESVDPVVFFVVPEPASLIVWLLGASVSPLLLIRRRR